MLRHLLGRNLALRPINLPKNTSALALLARPVPRNQLFVPISTSWRRHYSVPAPKPAVPEVPKRSTLKDLVRLVSIVKQDWKLLVSAICLLVVSGVIAMSAPKVIGIVLDSTKSVVLDNASISDLPPIAYGLTLYEFLGIFAGFLAVGTAATFTRVVTLRVLGEKIIVKLRSKITKRVLHQSSEFYDVRTAGDLISRLSSDCYIVSRSITQNVSDGFRHALTGAMGVGMMFYISPHLAGMICLFVPPLVVGSAIYGDKIRKISTQLQAATGALVKVSEEQLNAVKTIQNFNAQQHEMKRYHSALRNVFRVGRREAVTNATFYSCANLLGDASFMITLAYGTHLVLQGNLTVGDMTAFMMYTEYCGSALLGLSSFYSELMKGVGASSRLFEILDHKYDVSPTHGVPARVSEGKIEFKNVTFAYPTRPDHKIFNDLSFEIGAGENVCLVAPSGCGKSTITSLITKQYKPELGKVLIDGQNVREANTKSLRSRVSVVSQIPTLMSGTVWENLTYGRRDQVAQEDVEEVCRQCHIHDFVAGLPQGYQTPLIGGKTLSGGQVQRLAIARALLTKPKVLILDEATSALDSESEMCIADTVSQLHGVTVISIAHRRTTIERSGRVIVLGKGGKVVEQGEFNELMFNGRPDGLWGLLNEQPEEESTKKANETEVVVLEKEEFVNTPQRMMP